jgi:hypothetical protein
MAIDCCYCCVGKDSEEQRDNDDATKDNVKKVAEEKVAEEKVAEEKGGDPKPKPRVDSSASNLVYASNEAEQNKANVYEDIRQHILAAANIDNATMTPTTHAVAVSFSFVDSLRELCHARYNIDHSFGEPVSNYGLAVKHIVGIYRTAFDAARSEKALVQEACNAAFNAVSDVDNIYHDVYAVVLAAVKTDIDMGNFVTCLAKIIAKNAATYVRDACAKIYGTVYPGAFTPDKSVANAHLAAKNVADAYCAMFNAARNKGVLAQAVCEIACPAVDIVNNAYHSVYAYAPNTVLTGNVTSEAAKTAAKTAAILGCEAAVLVSGACGARYVAVYTSGASASDAAMAAQSIINVHHIAFNAIWNKKASVQEACDAAFNALHAASAVYYDVYTYVCTAATIGNVTSEAAKITACDAAVFVSGVYGEIYGEVYADARTPDASKMADKVAQSIATVYSTAFTAAREKAMLLQAACNSAHSAVGTVKALYHNVYTDVFIAASADNPTGEAANTAANITACDAVTFVSNVCNKIYAEIYASGASASDADLAVKCVATTYHTAFHAARNKNALVRDACNVACNVACSAVGATNDAYRRIYHCVIETTRIARVLDNAIAYAARDAEFVSNICGQIHVDTCAFGVSAPHAKMVADKFATVYCTVFATIEKDASVRDACDVAKNAVHFANSIYRKTFDSFVFAATSVNSVLDDAMANAGCNAAASVSCLYGQVYATVLASNSLVKKNTKHTNASRAALSVAAFYEAILKAIPNPVRHTAESVLMMYNNASDAADAALCAADAALCAADAASTVYCSIYLYVLAAAKTKITGETATIAACDAAAFVSSVCGMRYVAVRASGALNENANLEAISIAELYRAAFAIAIENNASVRKACEIAKSACEVTKSVREVTKSVREVTKSVRDVANTIYGVVYGHVLNAAVESERVLDEAATINAACNAATYATGLYGAHFAVACTHGASVSNAGRAADALTNFYCTIFTIAWKKNTPMQEACKAAAMACNAVNTIYGVVYGHVLNAALKSERTLDSATINAAHNDALYVSGASYTDALALGILARHADVAAHRVAKVYTEAFDKALSKDVSVKDAIDAARAAGRAAIDASRDAVDADSADSAENTVV